MCSFLITALVYTLNTNRNTACTFKIWKSVTWNKFITLSLGSWFLPLSCSATVLWGPVSTLKCQGVSCHSPGMCHRCPGVSYHGPNLSYMVLTVIGHPRTVAGQDSGPVTLWPRDCGMKPKDSGRTVVGHPRAEVGPHRIHGRKELQWKSCRVSDKVDWILRLQIT